VLSALASDDQLEGIVISFSDSGSQPRVFAVVEVVRRQTVIVPVERLKRFPENGNSVFEGGE